MSENMLELITGFIEFSKRSMKWCSEESEKATTSVNDILNILIDDANRMSSMSEETLKAVKELKTKISDLMLEGKTSKLIFHLQKLSEEHKEVSELVYPILENLQFQDKIRQSMENELKMLDVWKDFRQQNDKLTDEEKIKFGQKLLECTTMIEERDLIRKFIPELPEEKKVDDVMLF